jgi:hypothetical protein
MVHYGSPMTAPSSIAPARSFADASGLVGSNLKCGDAMLLSRTGVDGFGAAWSLRAAETNAAVKGRADTTTGLLHQ